MLKPHASIPIMPIASCLFMADCTEIEHLSRHSSPSSRIMYCCANSSKLQTSSAHVLAHATWQSLEKVSRHALAVGENGSGK